MTTPATTRDTDVFTLLADLVEAHYVLEDRATEYGDRIRSNAADLACYLPDIQAANEALHTLVPDRHLALRRPAPDPTDNTTPVASPAGGIHRIEDLGDGIWCLEMHPYFPAPDIALPSLRSAAQLTANARGLILDLQRCFGGDTDTAALIHGWLLGPEPVPLGRFEHRGYPSTDYTSDPRIGAFYTGPVRILTSSVTFSGGEDIAYVHQARGRARVIGEQTRGGAHPVEHFTLPGGRVCQIPVARSVITATGTNWEGVGVTPDHTCPAVQALDHARHDLATRTSH